MLFQQHEPQDSAAQRSLTSSNTAHDPWACVEVDHTACVSQANRFFKVGLGEGVAQGAEAAGADADGQCSPWGNAEVCSRPDCHTSCQCGILDVDLQDTAHALRLLSCRTSAGHTADCFQRLEMSIGAEDRSFCCLQGILQAKSVKA